MAVITASVCCCDRILVLRVSGDQFEVKKNIEGRAFVV